MSGLTGGLGEKCRKITHPFAYRTQGQVTYTYDSKIPIVSW